MFEAVWQNKSCRSLVTMVTAISVWLPWLQLSQPGYSLITVIFKVAVGLYYPTVVAGVMLLLVDITAAAAVLAGWLLVVTGELTVVSKKDELLVVSQ